MRVDGCSRLVHSCHAGRAVTAYDHTIPQEKLVTAYLDQELGNFPVAKVSAEVPHALTALVVAHVMSTTEDGDLLVL
jgi:hypothetical protein